ncbi:MAG: hypothetical protein IH597_16550 [Bacteroidales bacterium]|nr:hypothetical protein [Bacteroidales bacterium]
MKKYKKNSNIRVIVMLALLISFMAACIKDQFDVEKIAIPAFKPSIAVPLISSSLTLKDILEKTSLNIIEDPDSKLITMVYETRGIFSQVAEDVMQPPDQHYTFPEVINYIPPLPGEVFTYSYNAIRGYTTEIEGQRIDTLFFKAGILTLQYTSDIDYDAVSTITSPSLREKTTDAPLVLIKDIIQGANNEIQLELKDYYMIFAHDQLEPNSVSFDFVLQISGAPGAVPANYQFDTDVFLTGVRFQKMIGYFGQYNYSLSDTLFFDVFENLTEGYFQIDEGSVDLEIAIHNTYGMPIWLSFFPFTASSDINPPYNVDVNLFGPGIPNEFEILAPTYAQLGQTATTLLETNSNIGEAINMSPQYIYFGVSGISNPGLDPNELNFVLDTSSFSIDVITKIELFGLLENFILQDTLDFNVDIPDEVESAEFKIKALNGFPLELDFQAYFMSANYQVLDSLITDQVPLLKAAPVGPEPEYRVTDPIETTFVIPVPKEKMSSIAASEFIIIKGVVSSTNNDNVKIYSDYTLDIRMSAILNTNIAP